MKKVDSKVASGRAGGPRGEGGTSAPPDFAGYRNKIFPSKDGLVSNDVMVLIMSLNFGTKPVFEKIFMNQIFNFNAPFLLECIISSEKFMFCF